MVDVYLNIPGFEPKNLKRTDTVPHAWIDLNFTWEKGYPEEIIRPTLTWIGVPTQFRGKGYAKQIVSLVLDFMKNNDVPYLAFDCWDADFWQVMTKRFKGNVTLTKNKRHGIIHLDKMNISEVF